jgi:hypothetical protein
MVRQPRHDEVVCQMIHSIKNSATFSRLFLKCKKVGRSLVVGRICKLCRVHWRPSHLPGMGHDGSIYPLQDDASLENGRTVHFPSSVSQRSRSHRDRSHF